MSQLDGMIGLVDIVGTSVYFQRQILTMMMKKQFWFREYENIKKTLA